MPVAATRRELGELEVGSPLAEGLLQGLPSSTMRWSLHCCTVLLSTIVHPHSRLDKWMVQESSPVQGRCKHTVVHMAAHQAAPATPIRAVASHQPLHSTARLH